ncbi:MAG: hypothetical protein AB1546_16735 [bacterium]
MKRMTTLLILLLAIPLPAKSSDFWTIFGENLAYRHAIKGSYIPDQPYTNRLTSDETLNLAVISLGSAFTKRFAQVAAEKKDFAINQCVVTDEPYRCYSEIILKTTLDEMGFMPEINLSDKFVKKVLKFYDNSIRPNESLGARMERARRIPPWKKFNPRISVDFGEPELVAATPFYTFFNIYVEPRWGTKNGPRLVLIKYGIFFDIDKEGLLIRYRLREYTAGKKYYAIHIRPEGSIWIDTIIISR